jgi:hypothetical protein
MIVASALFESSYGARDRDGVRGRVGLTPSFTASQSPPASRLSTRLLATFCRLTRQFFRTLCGAWRPASAFANATEDQPSLGVGGQPDSVKVRLAADPTQK